jgi:acetyl esterase
LTPEQARASFLDPSWLGEFDEGVRVEDRCVPKPEGAIPVRVYASGGPGPQPVLVLFHGGGFVLGALIEFDPFCSYLAKGASCLVVSVGYRLAPEFKHPAAVEDAWEALRWVALHAIELGGDPGRIAVIGDSAGANLATVVSILARDAGFPAISLQVLICPWVDLSVAAETSGSFRFFGEGPWLSAANIRWYRDHYLRSLEQGEHWLASPLRAADLRALPPALIVTAEFDVLADQGEAYARRLEEGGVTVTFSRYSGMLHDFAILPGKFTAGREAIQQIAEALGTSFRSKAGRGCLSLTAVTGSKHAERERSGQ